MQIGLNTSYMTFKIREHKNTFLFPYNRFQICEPLFLRVLCHNAFYLFAIYFF